MALIEVRGVEKTYETRGVLTHALRGVDLDVDTGEFTVLAGPSGSGKTTLLNLIGALDAPTEGSVFLDGNDLSLPSAAQLASLRLHSIGFVFQAFNLIPVLTARENVEFVMELQGVAARERRQRALGLLEEIGLGPLADKRPMEMSGGQQQRVAVARAIAGEPRIVLADEPTANLDSASAGQLLDLMEGLNRDREVTFLFSTHDSRIIDRAKRTVYLSDGQVVAKASSQAA